MLVSYMGENGVEYVTFIKKETSNYALCIQNAEPRYLELSKLSPIVDPRKEFVYLHRGDVIRILPTKEEI